MPTSPRRSSRARAAAITAAGLLLLVATSARAAAAQTPITTFADAFEGRASARTAPVLHYVVRLDPADRSALHVTLHVRQAPDTLRLAIPAWAPGAYRLAGFSRNVRDLTVSAGADAANASATAPRIAVTRPDSGEWRALLPASARGTVTVRYRVVFPTAAAASTPNNRAFFRETGALVDGPATFLYLVGEKLVPAHVALEIPADWRVATGLAPTAAPRTWWAPSYDVLIDSPILMGAPGALRSWHFAVDGVPHQVALWQTPSAVAFDTAAFVDGHRRVVAAGRDMMGRLPYRDFAFLYVDSAGGGLEHLNSTTIGTRTTALATDPQASAGTMAHEFFHLWNIKRLRPAALGPFDYTRPVRTTSLWWSEGVTDFYGSVLQRRSGILNDSAAREEFAGAIGAFVGNPAHRVMSPEQASWVAWDSPALYGGYATGFYYTQGALLGELLELELRDRTGLRRGMDDLVRLLSDRFSGERGFGGEDILNAANETCGCDLQPFFASHVSGADSLDLDRYTALLGWRLVRTRAQATTAGGAPAPDLRISVIAFGGTGSAGGAAGGRPRISISDPTSAWGRAGLVTGDELVSIDGRPVASGADLRPALAALTIGSSATVQYLRGSERRTATVRVAPYETTRVRLEELPTVTPRQRAMRRVWMHGPERAAVAGAGTPAR